uniref:glutathione peroxidase n=1 Tax=Terrapene triunguis TaxID=2587831 RepID=A0A674I852_9SAUR
MAVFQVDCYNSVEGTIYKYGALTIDGQEYIPFGKYKGKMILFVNVKELAPHGLVILAFPSNQFGKQEPGDNAEILPALKYVRPGGGFVPNFQLFQKGDVNGEEEQKFYTFLKVRASKRPLPRPGLGSSSFGDPKRLFWEPLKIHDIKWNFEKFLVGPTGFPLPRETRTGEISGEGKDPLQVQGPALSAAPSGIDSR